MDSVAKPCMGHTHLKVADLERAIHFWRDVIGMDLVQCYGEQAAFLSWGGYHHHIGLNIWHSAGGTPPTKHHTGLFHLALLYPTREALVAAAKRVSDAGFDIYGHADHGVSIALYFDYPDGNGLCCTNPVRDSSRESSMVAGVDEQTEQTDLQDPELARV